jgi:hypothetical protein
MSRSRLMAVAGGLVIARAAPALNANPCGNARYVSLALTANF